MLLREYLDSLIARLGPGAETNEIIENIETRIAELFAQKLTQEQQIVEEQLVRETIEIIGTPEQIDPEAQGQAQRQSPNPDDIPNRRNKMRLYRDVDNRIIGGVCSGVAKRLGVDPWLVRIALLLLSVCYGAGVLIYIVLWLAVPAAKTPLQKLEMQGKVMTASTIKAEVNSQFQAAREGFRRRDGKASGFERFLSKLGYALLTVLLGSLKVLVYIIGVSLIVVFALGTLAVTVLAVLYIVGGVSIAPEFFEYFHRGAWESFLRLSNAPWLVIVTGWVVCVIPQIALLLLGIRLLIPYKMHRGVSISLLILWVVAVTIFSSVIGVTAYRMERSEQNLRREQRVPTASVTDTLRILPPAGYGEGDYTETDYRFFGTVPSVRIESTEFDSVYIVTCKVGYLPHKAQRGKRISATRGLADYVIPTDTARIFLPPEVDDLQTASTLISQEIYVTIHIPEGQYVTFDRAVVPIIRGSMATGRRSGYELAKRVWQMRDGELRAPTEAVEEQGASD